MNTINTDTSIISSILKPFEEQWEEKRYTEALRIFSGWAIENCTGEVITTSQFEDLQSDSEDAFELCLTYFAKLADKLVEESSNN